MDYSPNNNSNKNHDIFDDSEQSYELQFNQVQKINESTTEKLSSLYETRDRFIQFVGQLGHHKITQIREDIINHCEQNKKWQNIYDAYMSDEIILKIMNLRIEKMIKNKRIKKNWSDEDVQILIWVASKYSDQKQYDDIQKQLHIEDWEAIATFIPGVTAKSCMFKWLSLKNINLTTNNWSQDESMILRDLVKQNDPQTKSKDCQNWKHISDDDKTFRNAKQCREHWTSYLNPNLRKGPWQPEEDIQLFKCIKQNKGSKKWSQIVRFFDGRTQNALKNRYTLIIEKQKKHHKHKSQLELIEEYLVRCYMDQFTNQIKMDNFEEEERESEMSFVEERIKIEEKIDIESPQKRYSGEMFTQATNSPHTYVTPVKILKIDFKNAMAYFNGNLQFIWPGILRDGIFQKTELQGQLSSIRSATTI